MADKPIPLIAKLPYVRIAPPIPMVSVTEIMIVFRVWFKFTLCCIRFCIPTEAMVPKSSNIMPPSTADGIPQRKFPLAAACSDLRSYLPAERLVSGLHKSAVYAVLPKKFLVSSALRNAPAIDHKNLLRRPHGFQAVRNH